MEIKKLFAPDITQDFLATLSALSEVNLTVEEAKEVFRKRLRDGILTVIAKIDDKVVGTASLLVELKFLHKGSKAGHIEDIAVHPDFQRRGIGKAMVAHLIGVAKEKGCYKVTLSCKNELTAFYEKCGFIHSSCQMRFNCN